MSLLELVKKANKEADELLLLDQQRLENISVPELNVPEEQILKWFGEVKEKVQKKALKGVGVQKAEVYLYDVEEKHAGRAALESIGLKDIADWIEKCALEYAKLEKHWNFFSDLMKKGAHKKFIELQGNKIEDFRLTVLALWNRFDSSLLPQKIQTTHSRVGYHVVTREWYYQSQYQHFTDDKFPNILPRFLLSFNWEEEEAKESSPKKRKEERE